MDPNEFRRLGHELIDWVADYRERLEDLPVMSTVRPGEIQARLPAGPPQKGDGLRTIAADLDRVILPGISHWNHPGWFAYFPSNTDLSSVLADLVSSGLGAQGMNWVTSPACTEVEDVVMDWLRQMLGLSGAFAGVIHDTASTATLCALLCARERTSGFSQNRGGMQAEAAPLVVYASDQAHSSIPKAAMLAGFGADHLRFVETDDEHALRPDALEAAIAADVAAGRRPCALVASTGTTATTALDPLRQMAELAERHALWLHVDAALAGTAMICPECRWMWEGVERADSLVLNPHKWLGTGFDLSAYFVRDPEHLVRVMSTDPSYLRTAQDGQVRNLRDWGIPLGRRFRALKLWFVLRDQGVEGIRERVRRDMANARWLADEIDATPGWERMAPVPLQTVCLRHVPARDGGTGTDDETELGPSAPDDELAAHNITLAERLNADGRFFLSSADLKGTRIIRVSIGAEGTERRHVEALWRALQETAAQV
jgi:aromatic-L-amino-acid decarboxylase